MIECIKTAYEETNESKMFALYCATFPLMTSETFKTFDEFCGKQCVKVENKTRSKEDILKEVQMICNAKKR